MTSTDEYVEHFDWSEVEVPMAIVEVITATTDQEPDTLEALYNYIDPDALDRLVRNGKSGGNATVSFQYDSYRITVEAAGNVAVERLNAD